MSRTPNEVSLSMPAIRFDVAVYGIIYGNISRVTVESWQCRLSDELLDQLMVVSLLAAKKTEQEETKIVCEAIKLWHSKKKRYFA